MKKVLVFVGIAVFVSSLAAANINPSLSPSTKYVGPPLGTEANGTLGSLTIVATQVGALQVQLNASVTTAGGDGVPVQVTFGGNTYTLNNQVWLYGQIYDSPWNGGCTWWTTSPGTDWCAADEQFFLNSPTPLHNFALSFTTTVPLAQNYQTFAIARGGLTWITTGYNWFNTSQYVYTSVAQTIYIGSTQVPTPTPQPHVAAEPVPTLNWMGILAMIAIMAGIAIFVMASRK